jgi:hypothetical protein
MIIMIIISFLNRFVKTILETNNVTPPGSEHIYDLDNPYGAKTKVSIYEYIYLHHTYIPTYILTIYDFACVNACTCINARTYYVGIYIYNLTGK